MAIVFLAHNGIGLGHLSRASTLMELIADEGETPVLINQCRYNVSDAKFPQSWIFPLRKEQPAVRARKGAEIGRYAAMYAPSIVIEDTLPAGVQMPSEVGRVLIVRPTDFEHLTSLQAADGFDAYAISDAPGSATWPYTAAQTEEILDWERWSILGPIYRTVNAAEITAVEQSYGLDSKACVFTMGGGGEHAGADDATNFLVVAHQVREHLLAQDPTCRMLFVKGPYFTAADEALHGFQVIDHDRRMPALLAAADLAVIRPGFNTIWECVAGRTPFIPVLGTSFKEPVRERLVSLREKDLILDQEDFERVFDPDWVRCHRERCEHETQLWPGRPPSGVLRRVWLNAIERTRSGPDRARSAPPEPKRILLIAVNGVGIGHVERMIEIGLQLQDSGYGVHLAIEGTPAEWRIAKTLAHSFLPRCLPPFVNSNEYSEAYKVLLEEFDPDCILYDVHRALPDWMDRDLLHRFVYRAAISSLPSRRSLRQLLAWNTLDRLWFLHSDEELSSIYGEQSFLEIQSSPIAATAGWTSSEGGGFEPSGNSPPPSGPFVVVVLGGGGDRRGANDTALVAAAVNDFAARARQELGLATVFVSGPYFQHLAEMSPDVMVHRYLSNLDAYLAGAELAILRPGFNTIRKALTQAQRILLLKTIQYEEASAEQAEWLARDFDVPTVSIDNLVDSALDLLSRPTIPARPKHPTGEGLSRIVASLRNTEFEDVAVQRFRSFAAEWRRPMPFLLRLDDVARLDGPTDWVLKTLSERNLPVSIEVMPYHVQFDEDELDRYDPLRRMIEVSQHGYSHLAGVDGWEEFGPEIDRGRQILLARFPVRFKGGYSPPYDRVRTGVGRSWAAAGGSFVSVMQSRIDEEALPVVRIGADLWDWQRDRPRSVASVLSALASSWIRSGKAGLVLHPSTLAEHRGRTAFLRVIEAIASPKLAPGLPSHFATRQAERPISAQTRRYHP